MDVWFLPPVSQISPVYPRSSPAYKSQFDLKWTNKLRHISSSALFLLKSRPSLHLLHPLCSPVRLLRSAALPLVNNASFCLCGCLSHRPAMEGGFGGVGGKWSCNRQRDTYKLTRMAAAILISPRSSSLARASVLDSRGRPLMLSLST